VRPRPGRRRRWRGQVLPILAKADARRAAIVERLTDFILTQGLDAATLRPLAAAAGTSDRMLLYYFADRQAILAAVLANAGLRLAEQLSALSDAMPRDAPALEAELLSLTASPDLAPYMRLWIDVAARAARGDPLLRAVGEQVARGFLAWIAARLAIPDPAERATAALRLLRLTDGAMVLRAVGVE